MNQALQQCHTISSTLVSMAEACTSMRLLKQIHGRTILTGHHQNHLILAKILRFTAVSPSGDIHYAHKLFVNMPQPNTFFYNTLIRGFSKSPTPSVSVGLFNQMRWNCVHPDGFTFTFLLKARSRMNVRVMNSDEIHGVIVKTGFCLYLFVRNALIHLYANRALPVLVRRVFDETTNVDVVSWSGLVMAYVRAGELDYARRVFDVMPVKDVVSWTAIISGFAQAKRSREALDLFWEMRDADVRPDEVTMVSVVVSCTNLGDVRTGLSVHRYIDENGFNWMISLSNTLIDMYAKCGCMDRAWEVFNNMTRKSLITWNSLISACANHGIADDAFDLFNSMLNSKVHPDEVTFLAILVAYTHKGCIDEGFKLFESMSRDYGVEPCVEHYGCMVDMLGRAGRLEEAYAFIINMPLQSNDKVWGALLAACRIYGDVEMGERVVKKLLELKPDEGGYYILLRDIYVAAGQRKEASEMRQMMYDNGASKTPGSSWVGT